MMNRREFGRAVFAVGTTLAIPPLALAKYPVDHTWDGPHLSQFDDNDAIISTAHRAIGTLWYGNLRPRVIMSPSRVMGRVWNAIMPSQRTAADGVWICPGRRRSRGFLFCGAVWLPNEYLSDEIVLVNNDYVRDSDNHAWKKLNGWYRASRLVVEDPFGDQCFQEMRRVIG